MMGGHSAGDPLCATLGSSEALPCGFGPSPGSGGAMPLSMPEPVTSLKHLAGISAKQDQEILHTLQSSGLALNLKSLDEPEADINQMLSIATQGSAHESKTSSAMPEPATASKVRLKSSSMVEAEEYVRGYRPQSHAHSIQYPSGVRVDFRELAPVMRVVAIANSQSLLRIQQAIDSGMHVRTALHAFRECDRDGCGFLTWSNGQIRDFVTTVFIQLGLVPPAEMQTYAAHTLFDMNRTMCLSACDCLCLVDALLRAIFLVDGQEQASRRPVSSFSSSLSSPVAEELKQAQAETERLRQELEELKAAEAAAAEDEHLGRLGRQSPAKASQGAPLPLRGPPAPARQVRAQRLPSPHEVLSLWLHWLERLWRKGTRNAGQRSAVALRSMTARCMS
ncbi:unnamed protein product [Durusdinium trenchii]|uniref:EF-hand domain-containing protein n=1 Tax=Durusdinium trenchii TaxID=1381693 RepID=A0ABP0QS16_9DINO